MMVHVRGGDPMTLAPQVRDVAMAVDPSLRLVNVQRQRGQQRHPG